MRRAGACAVALAAWWPAIGSASPSARPVVTVSPGLYLSTGGLWGPDERSPAELYVSEARVFARGVVAPPGADPEALGDTSHFAYFLQLQTLDSPAILDARLTAQLDDRLRLDAGLIKVPISDEWLVPAPVTDFRERSRLARLLAPRRGVGVQLGGRLADGALDYVAGAYDQNTPRGAEEAPPIYAARVDGAFALGPAALRVGAAGGFRPFGAGVDRATWLDANARLDVGGLWITTELLFARFEAPAEAMADPTGSLGAFATVGYRFFEALHAIARYDHLTDRYTTDVGVIMALGWTPLLPVLLQVEYEVPVEGGAPPVLAAYARLTVAL